MREVQKGHKSFAIRRRCLKNERGSKGIQVACGEDDGVRVDEEPGYAWKEESRSRPTLMHIFIISRFRGTLVVRADERKWSLQNRLLSSS